MFKIFSFLFIFILSLNNSSLAVTPTAGDMAPEFNNERWIKNEPDKVNLEDFSGEVIFIEIWGVRCVICAAVMPEMQKLYDDYKSKGLHVYTFEGQSHEPNIIRMFSEIYGSKTLPISGELPPLYRSDGTVPHAWIIGVDGKIIWEGLPRHSDFIGLLKNELDKIAYPGLGKNVVSKRSERAARLFANEQYCSALKAIDKIVNSKKSEEADVEDALYIENKIYEKLQALKTKAQFAESTKDYSKAFELYKHLLSSFHRCSAGKEAEEKIKEYAKDRKIKLELIAAKELEKLLEESMGKSDESFKAGFIEFAKKYNSTFAGKEAESFAEFRSIFNGS